MKKILLINPIFQKTIYSPLPDRIERSRGLYPPLGLAYLAAILLKHNYDVRIYDADAEGLGFSGLKNYIKKFKADIVGITATSFTFLQAKLTAKLVRKFLSEAVILIGGPHVSLYPQKILYNEEFDIAVFGEAENTIIDLVAQLESGSSLDSVNGIAYRRDGKIIKTESSAVIENLDELPFPARSLLPNQKYFYPFGAKNKFTSIITSRGCPFNCIFCLRASGIHFGRKYRTRSPLNVLEELEEVINDYKINEIFFYDDIFTLNKSRILELSKGIINRKLDISWNCRTRVDLVTPKLLKTMKLAGCERIHYGIESGDAQILKNLRKNITVSQIQKAFSWTKQAEIETFAYIMIGAPGETLLSIRRTMQLLKKINPTYLGFFITTLFPGTDLYNYALEQKLISTDIWEDFTVGKITTQPLPYLEENFNQIELEKILKNCYKEYYFRPSYIWNRIKSLKSFSQLSMNLRGFQLLLRL